jgi:hypothetical protein
MHRSLIFELELVKVMRYLKANKKFDDFGGICNFVNIVNKSRTGDTARLL